MRAVHRLRTLSEAECYARCYGHRTEEAVRIVKAKPPTRYATLVSGELLRTLFEEKLEAPEPEAA